LTLHFKKIAHPTIELFYFTNFYGPRKNSYLWEVIMGMRVGYARVSTVGQKLDVQLDHLADCDRIYREKASASSTKNRPELKNALDFVREEDVFVVTKLDRVARSVVDLSNIIQLLEEKNVDLVVLDQGIDTTTIYGKLQFNILASIGEFERGLITKRSL
jgi:DNA invertase Pin-like site-specific DNA recombinase